MLWLLLLALGSGMSRAQHPRVRTFAEPEGLPSAQVRGLAEDVSGRLWVLSRGHLSYFDGREWNSAPELPEIGSGEVGLLAADRAGGIWVASAHSPLVIARFWEEQWRLAPALSHRFNSPTSALLADFGVQEPFVAVGSQGDGLFLLRSGSWQRISPLDGLASAAISAVVGDREQLYVGTPAGLQRVTPDRLPPSFIGEDSRLREPILALRDLAAEGEGRGLAILTPGWFGVLETSTGQLRVLVEEVDLLGTMRQSFPVSPGAIAQGSEEDFYFGNPGAAFYLEAGTKKPTPLGIREGLLGEGLTDALRDRAGGIWLGSVRGLGFIPSRRFLAVDRREGLPESEVTALLETSPDVWLVGQNWSLSLFEYGSARRLVDLGEEGPPATSRIMELATGQDGVWIAAMERGLGKLGPGGRLTWLGTSAGLPPAVQSVATQGGQIWVAGGSDGLYVGDGQRFQRVEIPGMEGVYVRRVFAVLEGEPWAATTNGLLIRRGEQWVLARAEGEQRQSSVFSAAVSPAGDVLVGSLGGLFRLDGERLVAARLGEEKIERPVFALLWDSAGSLWAGTDDGVIVWSGDGQRRLSLAEGLAGREVNRGALVEDHRGRVWIGTEGGASIYLRESDRRALPSPTAEIVAIEAGGEPFGKHSPPSLPHWRNHLFFEIRGVSLAGGGRLRCRYRLEGFDAAWTELMVLPRVPIRYTNLPPGRYRFHLMAGFEGGAWSDVVSSREIVINRPFWRRPWLLALILLASAAIAWWVIRSYAARRHASLHDSLTGLPNRVWFEKRLSAVMNRWQKRIEPPYAVLFLDVDRFKNVNDSLGHGAGDQLLETIAGRLRSSIPSKDVVARLSGDEFTVLLDEVESAQRIGAVAERLHRAFEKPFRLQEHEVFVGVSIGIAAGSAHYQHPAEILRDADIAMYRAKENGRGRYEFFSPEMHETAVRRLRLETGLRRALERDELRIVYQAIVSLDSGEARGCEALLRWAHPRRGLLLPAEFLHMAEETGLILAITDWALDHSCRQLREWRDAGLVSAQNFHLNINLSPRQLFRLDLAERLVEIVDGHHIDRSLVTLEVTESAVMDQVETARWVLERCQELGLRIALDDFGTGHSSLSQLQRLAVSELKLDSSFVDDLETNAASREIVRTVVGLGRNLDLRVIAEGVETEGQRRVLQELGCQWAQGFLFSEPVAGESFRVGLASD